MSIPKSQKIFPSIPINKKEYEHECVRRVLRRLPEYSAAQSEKHETPDVLVTLESSTIGVEVVDFVRGQTEAGSTMLRKHNSRDKIADYARYWFEQDNNAKLHVQFSWCSDSDPAQNQMEAIGKVVAEIVSKAVPNGDYSPAQVNSIELAFSPIGQHLAGVNIMRLPQEAYSFWSSSEAEWTGWDYVELQRIIDRKNLKCDTYRKASPEVWLVISVMGKGIATSDSFTLEDQERQYDSAFDRIFVYRWQEDSLMELKLH